MLICDLLNKYNIEKYHVDGLIINSYEYSCFTQPTFKVDELEEVVNLVKRVNKKVFISADRIIEEFEVDDFYKYLNYLNTLGIDYLIFSDLCVLDYCQHNDYCFKLLFDSKTMITNKYDAMIYKDMNVDVMIANELTIEDMIKISEAGNTCLEIYGYHQIFYSRRRIFDSYNQYNHDNYPYSNKKFNLQEEFRSEFYPIYQNQYGTFVYSSSRFMMMTELSDFENIKLFKINGNFIEENELLDILDIYSQALNGGNLEELEKQLLSINDNITKGFLHNKSILLKGEE